MSGSPALKSLYCGLAVSVLLAGVGSIAHATNYYESTQGDLSNFPGSPTNIGSLTLGDNYIVGSSIPSGNPIPGGHGALTNQDNDFFTFDVKKGEMLTHFYLGSDAQIMQGDRFFLGIYPGDTSPVNPSNPTPVGLLGYTLPGTPQIGTDLLPALAASDEPGFPPLQQHFSGNLGAGAYTVWLVDGDNPVSYDLNLVTSAVPEPGTWALMLLGIGGIGIASRLTKRKHDFRFKGAFAA